MVMTHLADITDRIDRSNSPRGGGEERELDSSCKDHCGPITAWKTYVVITIQDGFYCSPGHLADASYDQVFRSK